MGATHSYKRFHRLSIYKSHWAVWPINYLLAKDLLALYSTCLKGESFGGFGVINLYLTTLVAEDGLTEKTGGFIDFYLLFNFSSFQQVTTGQERKQFLLAAIQAAVLRLAQQEGWETARFEQAYQACSSNELQVNWQ
ncbi:MAG: hypothetical protein EOO63_09280 [Hymenobacter sp.]|nr:MAG: hypothetical protein EOO63_09280 [Hymenobacter sp.]